MTASRLSHSYGDEMDFVQSRLPASFLALVLVIVGLMSAETALARKAGDPVRIVALGDSLTAGYGLPASAAFPVLLEAALKGAGENVIVDNAGVSGDTTSGGLERLDWAAPEGVDAVIVELGANDMLRGLSPDIPRKNLDEILTRLNRKGVAILLAGMLATPNLGPDYAAAFNSIYPDLAKKHGALLYPFFFAGLGGDVSLLQKDGLHPTRAGVEKIVADILPSVRELIAKVRLKDTVAR